MTEARRRNQQRSLHLVMLQAPDKFRQRHLYQHRSVRNKTAEAPESRVQLSNHSVAFELQQPIEWNLNIHILLHECWVVAASGKAQVTRIDLGRNLAESVITIRRGSVERICAIDVRPGRTDQRQIQHR